MPLMVIRTKIIATVGPACIETETLAQLAEAGCDVFRINLSHGTEQQHARMLENIRTVEKQLATPVAVIADLCGPKIRVGPITGGSILLAEGSRLEIHREPIEGQADRISTTLGEMIDAVRAGQKILLDEGKIFLEVEEVHPPEKVICRVVSGGVLASGKGVNLPQTALATSALTEKDRNDVAWIADRCNGDEGGFDYVALSFVRSAADIEELRQLLHGAGCEAHIIAKIEKPQAMEQIEAIVDAADAVMVARGDMGVEMDLPAVPIAQKKIARLCQQSARPCIIATQMLDSMRTSPTPTRAEVSDVANAVLDHADAVMLSGETAVGKYPVQAVAMMNDIVSAMQAYHDEIAPLPQVKSAPQQAAAGLARAVREIISAEEIAAVAVFTITGATARLFAKHRLPRPILAMSPNIESVRRMCLYYGVAATRQVRQPEHTREILALASKAAMENRLAKKGDKIVVVSGRPIGAPGNTNTLVVHTIE